MPTPADIFEVREDDLTEEEREQFERAAARRRMGELIARNGQLEIEAAQLAQQVILRGALARRRAEPVETGEDAASG